MAFAYENVEEHYYNSTQQHNFKHRIHKVTWVSPDRATENQIEHIAISKKWRRSLLDVRNRCRADISSDHHLLIATIRLKVAAIKNNKNGFQKKFNTYRLEDPVTRSRFTNAVRDSYQEERDTEEHIGYRTSPKKPWLTGNTWNLINQRAKGKNEVNCIRQIGQDGEEKRKGG
ncbi:uncharacterized protein LOC135950504 [Calliphora vicina]|uniref:uncharacterized protein LOC135950504 n=1 Tax=Calliphora vicina TaxID=7373 RepID=UPI00325A4BCF